MQIACPACSATYEVEDGLAGDSVQCVCGREFVASAVQAAAPPPSPAPAKKKQPPPSFGKAPPKSLIRTLLDLGWDAADFRRYENAGYGLLCWYVRWLQRIQRIAVAFLVYFTAKVLYETFDLVGGQEISFDLLWGLTKALGSVLLLLWGSCFASLIFTGAIFQMLKAGISIEMNTRKDE